MRSAAATSADELAEVARALAGDARLSPMVGREREGPAWVAFFERVAAALDELAGADADAAVTFRERLALVYSLQRRHDDAARLLERSVASLERRLGPAHASTWLARGNLAIQYRNLGRADRAEALFANSGVCEHLRPVEAYLRAQGARVAGVGRPWSRNCRTWVVLDGVVLDAAALKARFELPDFVVVHTHRGTHEGSEHGLVCQRDHDALIGAHPDVAGGMRVIG